MSSSLSSSSAAAAAACTGKSISSIEPVLISIRDLLEAKLRSETRRNQADKDQQLANEWLAAAAAVDRICFIALAVLLVTGSVVFLVLLLLPK